MENLEQPSEEPKKEVKRSRARWWIVGVCLTIAFLFGVFATQNLVGGLIVAVMSGIVPTLVTLITRLFSTARWHIVFLISWILSVIILIAVLFVFADYLLRLLERVFIVFVEAIFKAIFG